MLQLIDTHCHLDLPEFDLDRENVLERARQAGIDAIVIPSISANGLENLLSLAATDSRLYAAAGLHPLFLNQHADSDIERIRRRITDDQVLAIGECGLDYTRGKHDSERQKMLFEAHVELSATSGKPLLIHANKAVEDVLLTLKKHPDAQGIVHSFNGSQEQALRLVETGFKLGFGGAITHTRARRLRALVEELPLDAMVLETDAPFQTGMKHQGQRNQPAWLVEVLAAVAELKNLPKTEVARVTTATARRVFGIS